MRTIIELIELPQLRFGLIFELSQLRFELIFELPQLRFELIFEPPQVRFGLIGQKFEHFVKILNGKSHLSCIEGVILQKHDIYDK